MSGFKRNRGTPEDPGKPVKMSNLQRTPPNTQANPQPAASDPWTMQTEMIKKLFDRQSEEMKDAEIRQAKRIAEAEERITAAVDKRINQLEQVVEELHHQNEQLKKGNQELASRIIHLERETRQTNIIAAGIDFATPQEGYEKLNDVIQKATNGAVRAEGIRTFATRDGTKKIVARCRSDTEKRSLFRVKKNLTYQSGDGKVTPVYVNDDLPREDRIIQSRLVGIAKEKRKANHQVRIGTGKLMIDGIWHFYNDQTENIEPRPFRKISSNTTKDV